MIIFKCNLILIVPRHYVVRRNDKEDEPEAATTTSSHAHSDYMRESIILCHMLHREEICLDFVRFVKMVRKDINEMP